MARMHGNQNGQQKRPALAAALPKTPSAIESHAREIMLALAPHRMNHAPAMIAAEAFNLARAFAAEAAKDSQSGAPSDV